MSITYEVKTIAPDDAVEMLGRLYKHQRKVRMPHVIKLAADMRDGRFILTPDPIVILEDGTLANGQHRLRAVVESNTVITSIVSTGWTEDAYRVMDGNKARSYSERVFQPWLRSNAVVAAVNSAMFGSDEKAQRLCSDSQRTAFALQYEAEITAVMGMKGATSIRAQVCGSCIRAMIAGVEADTVARFIAIVSTGVGETVHDSAAVRLFAYLNSSEVKSIGQRPIVYRKAQAALRAFLARKPLTTLQAMESELFPLPLRIAP